MLDHIGWWAATPRSTKWHLIESEIGLDVVTRCGRRLRGPEMRSFPHADRLCIYCYGLNKERQTLDVQGPNDR